MCRASSGYITSFTKSSTSVSSARQGEYILSLGHGLAAVWCLRLPGVCCAAGGDSLRRPPGAACTAVLLALAALAGPTGEPAGLAARTRGCAVGGG